MLRLLILFMLVLPAGLFAQEQFGKTKAEVKKELEQKAATSQPRSTVKATDSTLVLSVTEKSGIVKFTYGFDKKTGLCNSRKVQAGCDSCYKAHLGHLLQQDSYGWIKINENQYVSNFESRLLLELPADEKIYSFVVFKTQWTKELYDILVKK